MTTTYTALATTTPNTSSATGRINVYEYESPPLKLKCRFGSGIGPWEPGLTAKLIAYRIGRQVTIQFQGHSTLGAEVTGPDAYYEGTFSESSDLALVLAADDTAFALPEQFRGPRSIQASNVYSGNTNVDTDSNESGSVTINSATGQVIFATASGGYFASGSQFQIRFGRATLNYIVV